jgi:hypothetical protein
MKYNFCTYFDCNYLPQGLALYHSLKRHCPEFHLWILCMDQETYNILNGLKLSDIELIRSEDFECGDEGLRQAKENRTAIEYYFTCTPSLLLFIFDKFPEMDLLTYIDADIYFFSDPLPIYREISDSSIAIIEHRHSTRNRKKATEGVYNVGWLSFRRDENAFGCLKRWRLQCNEWCYDRVEVNRFADQKYLDDWPLNFDSVHILQHKGANLANWNIDNYEISVNEEGSILVGAHPLIFFHFHGLKHWFLNFYDTGAGYYRFKISKIIRRLIYEPYLKMLLNINKDLSFRFNMPLCFRPARRRDKSPALKQLIFTIYGFIKYKSYVIAKGC